MKCRRPNCQLAAQSTRGLCEHHTRVARREEGKVYVPSGPAARRVAVMRARGLSWASMAELTGVSTWTLRSIGNRPHTFASSERAILSASIPAAQEELVADGYQLPIVGTRRRLQALVALGYTNAELAKGIDYPLGQFHGLLFSNTHVTAAVARKVKTVFDDWQMSRPGERTSSRRARLRAERLGWPPPFAWDEDQIDDPSAGADALVCVWSTTRRLRALHRMGFAQNYMAERLGITQDEMSAILRFHDSIPWTLMDAAEKLFDELRFAPSDDPRLSSRRAGQVRSNAAKYGWPLPDDLGNVFRKPTKKEMIMDRSNDKRLAEMRELKSSGKSVAEIAQTMGVNQTTIYNWLAKEAA